MQSQYWIIIYLFLKENRIGNCDESEEGASDTPELGMDNVGGVFLVLFSGLGMAILIGILEFVWNVRAVSIDEKVWIKFSSNRICQFGSCKKLWFS